MMFSSCSDSEIKENINGHWHLFHRQSDIENLYYKLDISNNSIAKLEGINYVNFNKSKHKIDFGKNIISEERRILLWIDGQYEEFKYFLKKDSIFLIDIDKTEVDEYKYYGIKRRKEFCKKETDFYSSQLVSINLPIKKSKDIKVKENLSTNLNVYFGRNKFTNKESIQFDQNIKEINDINLKIEKEKFKIKIPKHKRDSISVILNIDKNILKDVFIVFLNEVEKEFKNQIYQRKITHEGDIILIKVNKIEEIFEQNIENEDH